MLKPGIFLFIAALLCTQGSFAQNRVWGSLIIKIPEGWSSRQKGGVTQFSNYNIAGSEPVNFTLFSSQPFSGRPDTLFAYAWNKHVTEPPVANEIPRWRRYYTNDGLLVQQGFVEFPQKEQPLYRQLNVFILDSSYQACLIETTSSKYFRQIQGEWQDRLMGVSRIPVPGKK